MKTEDYFKLAITEAKKAIGFTSPNPAVGAILVKNGKVIAVGHTQPPGKNHAEIEALRKGGKKAAGCDLYVILEPCCHTGRTGPCSEAVIKAGIKKVFIGMKDPNPRVNGGGIKQLKKAGITVEMLLPKSKLAQEMRMLNQPFIKSVTTGLPYITMKAAVTLDGKIATCTGDSKWITGPEARIDARMERSLCDAVLVGAGTVAADNPELAPHGKYKDKKLLRVIIDGQLSSDVRKKVFRDEHVLVACADIASEHRLRAYDKAGVKYKSFEKKEVNLRKLFEYLTTQKIRSVYVEGGAGVHGALYDAALKDSRLLDKIIFYIAPKIIGGKDSISAVGGTGIKKVNELLELKDVQCKQLGNDIKISAAINYY